MYKPLSILWKLRTIYFTYAFFIIVGGCIAFVRKGSWTSLIVSILASGFIILSNLWPHIPYTRVAFGVTAALTGLFLSRYLASGAIFPAGILFAFSSLVLVATYLLYKEYYRVSKDT